MSSRLARALTLSILCFSLTVACGTDDGANLGGDGGAGGGSDGAASAALSYYKDIKPLLDSKCLICHTEGGIGPFELTDYDKVYKLRSAIKAAVVNKTMPPWLADSSCTDYQYDLSLAQAQIDTIARWVDTGAKAGDPADAPKTQPSTASGILSSVDLRVTLPVRYKPVKRPDDYRCFVLDFEKAKDKDVFVTGYQVKVDNSSIVHHVVIYAAAPDAAAKAKQLDDAEPGAPGYTCFGGPGVPVTDPASGAQLLAGWAPGSPGALFVKGSGIRIRKGSKLIVQMHYNADAPSQGDGTDQSAFEFSVVDSVAKEGRAMFYTYPLWVRGSMEIKAGDANAKHSFSYDLTQFFGGKPITIYGANLHMHRLGKSANLHIQHANGQKSCLLDIPRWDFDWQRSYGFVKPKKLMPGDKLSLSCTWDNSAANQPVIDGKRGSPKQVNWGDGTSDEMCLASMYITID